MMMDGKRAWLYCRVAHPDATALEGQKRVLTKNADSQGLRVIGISAEQCSGLDYQRVGLQEVMCAAEDGEIDFVLIANISRLGRDVLKTNSCIRWLQQRDVKVLCVDGTIIEPITYSFADLLKAKSDVNS